MLGTLCMCKLIFIRSPQLQFQLEKLFRLIFQVLTLKKSMAHLVLIMLKFITDLMAYPAKIESELIADQIFLLFQIHHKIWRKLFSNRILELKLPDFSKVYYIGIFLPFFLCRQENDALYKSKVNLLSEDRIFKLPITVRVICIAK